MKQVIAITTITFLSVTANGQDYHNSAQTIFTNDPEFFIQSVLLVLSIYLILTFILTFIKLVDDVLPYFRIKPGLKREVVSGSQRLTSHRDGRVRGCGQLKPRERRLHGSVQQPQCAGLQRGEVMVVAHADDQHMVCRSRPL